MKRLGSDGSASHLDEMLAFKARHEVQHHWLQLDDVARRRWSLRPCISLWDAICLHSGLDPSTVPRGWPSVGLRLGDAIEMLVTGRLAPTAQRRLHDNLQLAIQAIKAGRLKAMPMLEPRSPSGNTTVDVCEFRDWVLEVSLPVAGPWRHRVQANGREVGYMMRFPRRPALASAAEAVLDQLWDDYACERVIDRDVAAVLSAHPDVSQRDAKVIARFVDPRDDRRGRLKGRSRRVARDIAST